MDRVAKAAGATVRNFYFVVALFLLLGVLALLLQIVENRRNDEQLLKLLEQSQANQQILIDCTSPEGECFKEGQKRTAQAVDNINLITVYSVVCGERFDGEEDILKCVQQEFKSNQPE